MSTLHIVPDTQGNWRIIDDDTGVPLSRHETANGAERAARSLASAAHAAGMAVIAVPNPHYPPASDALELAAATVEVVGEVTPELVERVG